MRLLVDTQAILWYEASDNRLPQYIRELIDDTNNECFVSMSSLWEMAIKISLGKLIIEIGYKNFERYLLEKKFLILNIKSEHLTALLTLPQHHKDPFDRLIIAQAIIENLVLISADQYFSYYPVRTLW